MKRLLLLLALAGIFLADRPAHAGVDITLSTGVLQDFDATPLDDGSTMMLICDAEGDGFGDLTSVASAVANAFLNDDDDVILKRWAMNSGSSGVEGVNVEAIPFDLTGSVAAGDPLIVVWYSGLSEAGNPSAPGAGRRFGTYRASDWVVPPDGNSISLNMLTTDIGGDLDPAEGLSDQVTVGSGGSNTPPVAICQDVTKSAGTNCAAIVAATEVDNGSTDSDGGIVNRTLSPAGPYALGDTAVTLTVTDDGGATNSCTATITVNDTTAPTITCPSNISTTVAPSETSAVVNFNATVTDNCSTPTRTCAPSSGSTFGLGNTTVNCTVMDDAGNTNQCSFTVTVIEEGANQAPLANCQSITNAAGESCEASITADQVDSGSTDADGTIVDRTLNPGGPYPLGDTVVTLTVTDDMGATNSCSATITVVDSTAPTIACPSNISTTLPPTQTSAVITFDDPTVSDNCSGASATCVPVSGSSFDLGQATVTCTATDGAGNTAECTFTVTLETPQQQQPMPDLTGSFVKAPQERCKINQGVSKCRLKARIEVANIGEIETAEFIVRFFASDDASFDVADTQVGKDNLVKRLEPGRSKHIRLKSKDDDTVSGKFIIVVIDPTGSIDEEDDSNNQIVIGPMP